MAMKILDNELSINMYMHQPEVKQIGGSSVSLNPEQIAFSTAVLSSFPSSPNGSKKKIQNLHMDHI